MKVLILHQHFNTPEQGGPLRSYYLAKALTDRGHQVVVITARTQADYKVKQVEDIEVHYLPVHYDNKYGFLKRGVSFLRFAFHAYQVAKTLKNVNLCYAISVPLTVGLSAMMLKRFRKVPFVFEVGDLWPDAPIQLGFVKNKLFQLSLYRMEKQIYKSAEAIVALSPAIKSNIEQKVSRKEIGLIPNMADTSFYRHEAKDPALVERFSVSGKFVVSYIGAVGFANGLDFYLECARASQKANLPVQFFLCGEGAYAEKHKAVAKKLNITNLSFIPFQNREGVRQVMNISDAVFICYRPYAILETGSPNKYFDGLAAGKLIITNFGGWIKQEIEQHACGISVNAGFPHEFVTKIEPFLNDAVLLQSFQQRARTLAEQKYSRDLLSNTFAALLDSCVQEKD